MVFGAVDVVLLAVLGVCAATDVRTGKIYNTVTYPAILAGLAVSMAGFGPSPAAAVLGLLAGGGLLYVLFVCGWMGGGDVKLMAAVGTFAGFPLVLDAMFYSIFVGGVFAALVLIWRGEASAVIADVAGLLQRAPAAGSTSARRIEPRGGSFPFGVAIGGGTLIALLLHRSA